MTAPASSNAPTSLSPADPALLGRYVWHELLVPDTAQATAFYPAVAGWTVTTMEVPGSPRPYTLFNNGTQGVGGIQQYPADVKGTPRWVPYMATDDADRTCRDATKAGATVHMPPTDIPTVGRIAVLADPQGAMFAIIRPFPKGTPEQVPGEGEFAWHEMTCDDPDASFAFYQGLFGWQKQRAMDMGAAGTYQIYGRGEFSYGGFMRGAAEMPPSTWYCYVRVADLDAAVDAVKRAGGKIMMGPVDVPNDDRVAIGTDNQGAIVAFVARKRT